VLINNAQSICERECARKAEDKTLVYYRRVPLLVAACLCVDCKKIRSLPEITQRQKKKKKRFWHFSWYFYRLEVGMACVTSVVGLSLIFVGSNPGSLPLPLFY
jgi:hypothetical protein